MFFHIDYDNTTCTEPQTKFFCVVQREKEYFPIKKSGSMVQVKLDKKERKGIDRSIRSI